MRSEVTLDLDSRGQGSFRGSGAPWGASSGQAWGHQGAPLRAQGHLCGRGCSAYLLTSAFASYLEGGPGMGPSGSRGRWASSQRCPGVRTRTANRRAEWDMADQPPRPADTEPCPLAPPSCLGSTRASRTQKGPLLALKTLWTLLGGAEVCLLSTKQEQGQNTCPGGKCIRRWAVGLGPRPRPPPRAADGSGCGGEPAKRGAERVSVWDLRRHCPSPRPRRSLARPSYALGADPLAGPHPACCFWTAKPKLPAGPHPEALEGGSGHRWIRAQGTPGRML